MFRKRPVKLKSESVVLEQSALQLRSTKQKLFFAIQWLSIIGAACLLIILANLVYQFNKSTSQIFLAKSLTPAPALTSKQIEPKLLVKEGDSRINILLAGKGGSNHKGGNLTDAIVVVSIDSINKKISLMSVPRDLYLEIDSDGKLERINTVYSYAKSVKYRQTRSTKEADEAGMNALSSLVESHFDIPIHYYVLADFESFVSVVDLIGGVEMEFERPLFIKFANLRIPAGRQTLDGQTALTFVRSRDFQAGDFTRSRHQRDLLLALRDKIDSINVINKILLAEEFSKTVAKGLRTNLSLDEIETLYEIVRKIPLKNIDSIDLTTNPVLLQPATIDEKSVVIPVAGFGQFDQIQNFTNRYFADGLLKLEAATIAIVGHKNKTAVSQNYAKKLKNYGYNVVSLNTSLDNQATQTSKLIVRNPEKKYTLNYLENRLTLEGQKIDSSDDFYKQYQTDFIIVIGEDSI